MVDINDDNSPKEERDDIDIQGEKRKRYQKNEEEPIFHVNESVVTELDTLLACS